MRDLGYVGEGSQACGCPAPAATGTFYVGVLSYGSSALPDHVARRKVRWRAIYRRIIALRLEHPAGPSGSVRAKAESSLAFFPDFEPQCDYSPAL
jgi:hypothetical protein